MRGAFPPPSAIGNGFTCLEIEISKTLSAIIGLICSRTTGLPENDIGPVRPTVALNIALVWSCKTNSGSEHCTCIVRVWPTVALNIAGLIHTQIRGLFGK